MNDLSIVRFTCVLQFCRTLLLLLVLLLLKCYTVDSFALGLTPTVAVIKINNLSPTYSSVSSTTTALYSMPINVKPTVWSVFGDLASTTGSTNLGQGFPDWDAPEFVLESLKTSMSHQYTRSSGYIPLVQLLSRRYSLHLNREVDPLRHIAITVGASQALFLTLMTILQRDDEIIIFEPFFELYTKQIALTGAHPRFVPLGGSAATLSNPWALNVEALRQAITPKTKVLLLNSPHNPTGKVFTLEEMQSIAEVLTVTVLR